ncbi:discoidin domain-containing protein [Spirilliplanes yamanashiensis]|uniref:Licheninase n=1 Tax=Spirilliplanes yamanashiensis TaxID=42233 RepID=A0A8J3YEK5_9ACTN|nr:discoidin domain-containing protein [Spirilliplanes yamanashiensis]MDP9816725.1 hypothetical protein [Spirilliplanes yamanashiensis]GIJ06248.1 hypothetical protein Sya03_56000 [Spirilliplanes yamanashiensis]
MMPVPLRARRRLTARTGALAAALVGLLSAYIAVTVASAEAAETLLSQGKPVTASSSENASFPATAAVDGDAGTRWASAFSDPQWIRVDLGSPQAISRVALNWEAAYARAFTIETSTDGSAWTQRYATTTGAGGEQSVAVTGTARYVRLTATARATQFGVSLWEFQVFGGSAATPCGTANAAQGRPATASSTENAAFPASAAVDGDAGTRWASAFSDPQWLRVDLGSVQAICGLTLTWEAAFGRAFTVEASADGTTWSQLYATTTGAGGVQNLAVTGSGRYVRLTGNQRGTAYGYSLFEFAVRTAGGSTTTPPTTGPTTGPTTPPPTGARLLSYNKPATASTEQNDVNCNPCTADKAFDYDPASRWATSSTTGWVDPGWIAVDLGATAQISQVVLQWDPAYASAYRIEVSPDGRAWTPIYSTTTGRGLKETLNVSGSGRHVRMYGTARSGPYGYSLWEFQVYGTGGNPQSPPARPADPVFPATRLIWQDEFNGPAGSKPDGAKWTMDPGLPQNNEVQYYTDNSANAAMDGNGSLVIEARRESAGGRDYTSHRMNTSNKFHVQYGRIEARVKVPKGNGLWPAFWMMGEKFLQGRPWPYNGEIDIMEVLGRNTTEGYSTLHAPAYNGAGGYGQKYTTPGALDLSNDFHVWAVEWDSKGMSFKLDGREVFYADKNTVETTRGPWIFDDKHYIILNLAVGGDFPGPIDATTPFPSRMLVDYVRVYQ